MSPARLARYDGRTMLCPNRYAAPENSTGMYADPLAPPRPKNFGPCAQQLVDERLADEGRQHLVDHQPLVVPGRLAPGRVKVSIGSAPDTRTASTALLWNLRNAACRPDTMRFESLRMSLITAEKSGRRGTSSNSPPDSTRSLIGSAAS